MESYHMESYLKFKEQQSAVIDNMKTYFDNFGKDSAENYIFLILDDELRAFARFHYETVYNSTVVVTGRGGRRSGSGRKPSPDTEKRKAFSVSIPESLILKIQNYCQSRDCSVNQYIIDSIKMRLNK